MTSKERCLAVIRGQAPDRTPLFPLMMFFAADRLGISYSRFSTDPVSYTHLDVYKRQASARPSPSASRLCCS